MIILEFEAPFVPRVLAQNTRASWHASQLGPKADYKQAVALAAKAVMPENYVAPEHAVINLRFGVLAKGLMARERLLWRSKLRRPYRPQDIPNAIGCWKAGFDGLVEAGAIIDDSYRHMSLGIVVIDPEMAPGVTVGVMPWLAGVSP